jgi:hypothetical protein
VPCGRRLAFRCRSRVLIEVLDTIYTERYMGRPEDNSGGYDGSAVTNVTGFDQIDFALAHGSGDDNGAYFFGRE